MGLAIVQSSDAGALGDDAARVIRVASGDHQAFQDVVEAHVSTVRFSALRLLGDSAEADDITQDVFVRFWGQAGKLAGQPADTPLNLGGWLRRVAINASLDRLRAGRRIELREEPPDEEVAPEQLSMIAQFEARDAVQAALNALPDRQRVALVLFHFEEHSQREVAEAMEISEDALESLLARGRRKLRNLLADRWQDLLSDLQGAQPGSPVERTD